LRGTVNEKYYFRYLLLGRSFMTEWKQITVRQMRAGQSGRVAGIEGGRVLVNRLNALGIRPGKQITKVSSVFMRGPVTVLVDRAQVAIGYGMAGKIIVDVDGDKR
jgi:ferrous iron transport protein A